MADQSYRLPLATETLADSRGYYNDSLEALKNISNGPTEPEAADRGPYMLWADTTAGLLKQRNAANNAWIEVGKLDEINWDHVSLSRSGQVMAESLDMGGNVLDNVGLGGALSAARKQEVDLKADKNNPAFTGQVTTDSDPSGGNSLARRSWIEANAVAKAGDTMTGRLGVPSSPAPGGGDVLRKDEVENLATFNTTSGHNHDGANSRKIDSSNVAGLPPRNMTFLNTQISIASVSAPVGFTTASISAHTGSEKATVAILQVFGKMTIGTPGIPQSTNVRVDVNLRKTGETPIFFQARHQLENFVGTSGVTTIVFVPLDASEQFDYEVQFAEAPVPNTPSVPRLATINLIGWVFEG